MGQLVPSLMPAPARTYRAATLACKGCGAPVHPHEHACSYCETVPGLVLMPSRAMGMGWGSRPLPVIDQPEPDIR